MQLGPLEQRGSGPVLATLHGVIERLVHLLV